MQAIKYLVKQYQGKWAVFKRQGNKSNKEKDLLIEVSTYGLQHANALAQYYTRTSKD